MTDKNANIPDENLDQLLESLIDNPKYFENYSSVPFLKSWTSLYDHEPMEINPCLSHSFKVVIGVQFEPYMDLDEDSSFTKVYLGVRDDEWEYRKKNIEFGIHRGCLFVNELYSDFKIRKEDFVEGVELVLNVSPTINNVCRVKLTAVDQRGKVLTDLISNRCESDWRGRISPGPHFKYLNVEGVHPILY